MNMIEYHLEEIDAWRRGDRETPGQPSIGAGYAGRMLDMIAHHEKTLVALGHEPTIAYVRAHGFADGQRGRLPLAVGDRVKRADVTETSIRAFAELRGVVVHVDERDPSKIRVHWTCDATPEPNTRNANTVVLAND